MFGLFFLGFLCVAIQGEDDLVVSTSSGLLKGKHGTVLDKSMKMFLGVPYAVPPVGDLRFKPPFSFKAEGIERDAQKFASICYQPPHAAEVISPLLEPNKAEISEDCLYLNIYVPDIDDHENLPVLIWLAGEGFNYADPVQFDGRYLSVEANVILVTVSYRVSVFGFLSALHHDAPGNVGLLDQRAAMKWVKENIERFGGDSGRVTIFGRLTGAMSVAIHAFSPLSKEEILFQRVILMSGVPDGDWVFDRNPLNATFALAQATDCVYSSMSETIECFKHLPADALLKAALAIPDAWRPVFDFKIIYEHTLKAARKLNYNPVDILIGLNKNEGSLCLTALKAMKSEYFEKILQETLTLEDFEKLIEDIMMDVYNEKDDFINKLIMFQYSDSDVSKLGEKLVKFCGDLYISAHSEKLADIISTLNRSVYMYELAHRPSFSNQPSFIEAGHGDDVLYALGLPLSLKSLPQEEVILTNQMVKAVANFAYFGNPNAENSTFWPPFTTETRLLMKFDIQEHVSKTTHEKAVIFWHDIIPSAQHRTCALPPMASALVDIQDHEQDTLDKAYFLGSYVTVPTAEYMMLGLVCLSGFLLVVSIIAIIAMLRFKHYATFHRLS